MVITDITDSTEDNYINDEKTVATLNKLYKLIDKDAGNIQGAIGRIHSN